MFAQIALAVAIELNPAVRDPEFGAKIARLKQLLAERPDAPLLVILGSSRSASGIRPADFQLDRPNHDAPLVFNLALTGCGPIHQLQVLDRLRREGIAPRWVLAEIHPLLLHQKPGVWGEEQWMRPDSVDWHDLRILGRYFSQPRAWMEHWLRLRLLPALFYRYQLLNFVAPGWLDTSLRQDGAWRELDAQGWLPLICETDTQAAARRRRHARRQYAPAFSQFQIAAPCDAALREMVAVARRHDVRLAFFLMPEGELFRSWYSAESRREIATYLNRFEREERVPVFDTTTWCADPEFSDSHHLLAEPSQRFSRRFSQVVVEPFLAAAYRSPPGDQLAKPARANGRR